MMLKQFSLLSAAVLLLGFTACDQKPVIQKKLPTVIAAPVAEYNYIEQAVSIGEAKAEETVDLVARVSGFLKEANFKEGEHVKAGTVLFVIDPAQYEAELKRSEGELKKALADQKNANTEYDRQKTLYQQNAVAKKDYDYAEAKKLEADAGVLSAESNLKLAQLNLGYTKVVAPFDGWIGFKSYSAGNMVGPDGKKLATIQKSGRIKVDFNISDLDMMKLNDSVHENKDYRNQVPVEIYDQLGRKIPLEGRLYAWDNKINTTTGTMRLQAIFDDPDRILLPGFYIKEVRLQVAEPVKQIMVPEAAVTTDVAGSSVFLLTHIKGDIATVERRYLKTDGKDNGRIIVKSGLNSGELIVVSGIQQVRPGSECKFMMEGQNPNAAIPATGPVSKPDDKTQKDVKETQDKAAN